MYVVLDQLKGRILSALTSQIPGGDSYKSFDWAQRFLFPQRMFDLAARKPWFHAHCSLPMLARVPNKVSPRRYLKERSPSTTYQSRQFPHFSSGGIIGKDEDLIHDGIKAILSFGPCFDNLCHWDLSHALEGFGSYAASNRSRQLIPVLMIRSWSQ